MASIDNAQQSLPSSSDEDNTEDVLERMLKEAEALALKMSRQGSDRTMTNSTAGNSSHGSYHAVERHRENQKQQQQQRQNNDKDGDGDGDESNDYELEELLKKSEALLAKMQSGLKNNDDGGDDLPSSISSPTQENFIVNNTNNNNNNNNSNDISNSPIVEPPKTSPNAPTSVYVLDPYVGSDDVSSVGSNSLRSPMISPNNLKVPSYSSSTKTQTTDPIQEEPLMPIPIVNPVTAQNDVPNFSPKTSRNNNIKDNTSILTSRPTTTPIPDFTVTPREAKWEKVSSANMGDDDYVPLVDYTKLKGSPETTTTMNTSSSATHNSTPSDVSPENNNIDDDVDDIMAMNSTSSTPLSRVAAFRAQKRKLRRRRRRWLQTAFVALVVVTACSYFVFNKRNGDITIQAIVDDDNTEIPGDLVVENGVSDGTDDIDDAVKMVDKECIVKDNGEVSVGGENDLVEVHEEIPVLKSNTAVRGIQDVVEQGKEVINDSYINEEVGQDGVNDESNIQREMEDVDDAKVTATMDDNIPTETQPEKVVKPSNNETNAENSQIIDLILKKRCKNLFHKVFNKKCRKKKNKKGGPRSINLQAIAGI